MLRSLAKSSRLLAGPLVADSSAGPLVQVVRAITTTSGAQQVMPAPASAPEAPRWVQELGAVRNDWT